MSCWWLFGCSTSRFMASTAQNTMEDQQRRAQREFSVSLFHPFTVSLFPCCSFFIFHFSISLLLFFTVFLFLLNGPQFLFHCFHVSHFHFAVSLFFCFSVSLANCFSFHWFSVSLFRCFSLIYCLTVCLFLWSNVALFHWFSVSLFLFHWFTVSGCISENRGWWIPVRQLRQIDGNATGRQETGFPYNDKITKTGKQQTQNISTLEFLCFPKNDTMSNTYFSSEKCFSCHNRPNKKPKQWP